MNLSTDSNNGARTRSLARAAASIGVVASLVLFLVASHNRPPILIILIGGWVLAPFVGFFIADRFLRSEVLYGMMVLITLIALAVYSYAVFGSPTWKAAAPFVVVPLLSWALLAIGAVVAMLKPQHLKGE